MQEYVCTVFLHIANSYPLHHSSRGDYPHRGQISVMNSNFYLLAIVYLVVLRRDGQLSVIIACNSDLATTQTKQTARAIEEDRPATAGTTVIMIVNIIVTTTTVVEMATGGGISDHSAG